MNFLCIFLRRLRLLVGYSIGALPCLAYPALAQQDQHLLLVGINPGVGIGQYNSVGVAGGLDVRYQYPLRKGLAIIAKSGVEALRIKGRYSDWARSNFQTTAGLSVPLTTGPRYYFFRNVYGGLTVGADVALTKLVITSFRFEPGVGMVVPVSGRSYVDISTSVITSFGKGSGVFSFNFSYGLPWVRVR